MENLLARYLRLSGAQKSRFIGHLFGGIVSPVLAELAHESLAYAESVHPEGDLFESAMQEAVRLVRQEGLSVEAAEAKVSEQAPWLAAPPVAPQIRSRLQESRHQALGRIAREARGGRGWDDMTPTSDQITDSDPRL